MAAVRNAAFAPDVAKGGKMDKYPEIIARLDYSKKVPPEIQARLEKLLDSLPLELDPKINRIIVTNKRITEYGEPGKGYSAQWVESERLMRLWHKFSDGDFYHEVSHALYPEESESEIERLGQLLEKECSAPSGAEEGKMKENRAQMRDTMHQHLQEHRSPVMEEKLRQFAELVCKDENVEPPEIIAVPSTVIIQLSDGETNVATYRGYLETIYVSTDAISLFVMCHELYHHISLKRKGLESLVEIHNCKDKGVPWAECPSEIAARDYCAECIRKYIEDWKRIVTPKLGYPF